MYIHVFPLWWANSDYGMPIRSTPEASSLKAKSSKAHGRSSLQPAKKKTKKQHHSISFTSKGKVEDTREAFSLRFATVTGFTISCAAFLLHIFIFAKKPKHADCKAMLGEEVFMSSGAGMKEKQERDGINRDNLEDLATMARVLPTFKFMPRPVA